MPMAYKYLQVTKSKRFSTDGWETPNSPRHCGGSLYPTRSSLHARNQSQQVECPPDPTGSHRIPPDPTGSHLQVIGWKANAPELGSWRLVEDDGRRMQSLTVTGTRYCGYSLLGWPRKISCAKPANFLVSTWDSTSPSLIHDALAMLNLL